LPPLCQTLAIAPEMFARFGDVSVEQYSRNQKGRLKVPDAQVMSDLDATVAWAASLREYQQTGNTGLLGWRIVWLCTHPPR